MKQAEDFRSEFPLVPGMSDDASLKTKSRNLLS